MAQASSALQEEFTSHTPTILGLVFLGAGLAMTWKTGQQNVDLICERSTQTCSYTVEAMGQTQQEIFALDDVREATLLRDTSTGTRSSGQSDTQRELPHAVLHVDGIDQEVGLAPFSGGRHVQERLVDQVNQFLADPDQPELVLSTSSFAGQAWWFALWLFICLMMIFGIRNVLLVDVRPERNQLALVRRRWWQSSGRERIFPLAEVKGVTVDSRYQPGKTNGSHRLEVALQDGEKIPLTRAYVPGEGVFTRAALINKLIERGQARQ